MSNYSEYLKGLKAKHIEKFFGEVKQKSNKYFTFNHYVDDDNVTIITNNIKYIKGNPVLVVDNNKVVYLKDWLVEPVRNYSNGIYAYAAKINRKFFKVYTFKKDFEDMAFEKETTFDELVEIAKEQDENNMAIALGH